MQRREFFKRVGGGVGVAGIIPIAATAAPVNPKGERTTDQWVQLGTGTTGLPKRKTKLKYDVAVIGAGMAGISAAVAAARTGAKTVLINDRPVLGGNASSEIRVTVNGVKSLKPEGTPERETGIVEDLLIENRFKNPQESYPVWDHVVYDYVNRVDGLDVMMNTQAMEAIMDGDRIKSAKCWQSTTETEFTINAGIFADCSGDGLLAATAGALYRTGREASSEFGEKYAPEKADGWQMGASIMIQGKDMGRPMRYIPPSFAIPFDAENANDRKITNFVDGYWWVELGSEYDIIADQEENRHKLMGYLHGVWDYIKNSGNFPESANYAMTWVGSLPGRRESRRFIGDYILSEPDMLEHKHFDDAVAYGGWSLDEHCPGGIENLKDPPSYFHYHFRKVYEFPYRSLYSKNISNLYFAGRNVSQTHIALSSSRIQGTCALMGQAVGTGAAMCVQRGETPRSLGKKFIKDLQQQLLRDDVYIPNVVSTDSRDLARSAKFFSSSTKSGDAALLKDGVARDVDGDIHHWQSTKLPAEVQLLWEKPVTLSKIEIKCDTNLKVNIMMRKNPAPVKHHHTHIPPELLKSLSVDVQVKGKWIEIGSLEENMTRLIKFNFKKVKATAVRINLKETYGHPTAKLFEVRCYES